MRRAAPWLFAAVLCLLLGACGEESDDTTSGAADSNRYVVTASDLAFDPNELFIVPNSEVTIQFANQDQTAHTFTIDELDVDAEVAAGATETIVFTAPGLGSGQWHCRFHPQMVGRLDFGDEGAASTLTTIGGSDDTGADTSETEETQPSDDLDY